MGAWILPAGKAQTPTSSFPIRIYSLWGMGSSLLYQQLLKVGYGSDRAEAVPKWN